jgi:hypothetical protein
VGAFLYSCAEVSHAEASALADALPDSATPGDIGKLSPKGIPLHGGKVMAEFGTIGAEAVGLHSFASSFGFVRRASCRG